jgi:hypothetical protein
MNPNTIIALIAAAAIIALYLIMDLLKARDKKKEGISESWGKPPDVKYFPEDLEAIRSYFLKNKDSRPPSFVIDDITWRDLDMDDLFIRLNGTLTTPGEQMLYRLLREPCFDLADLEIRRKLIARLQKNKDDRTAIQLILQKLGKNHQVDITEFFFRAGSSNVWKLRLYQLLALASLASPLALFFNTGLAILLILFFLMTNMGVYYSRKFKISGDLASLSYLVRFVQCAGRIVSSKFTSLEICDFQERLKAPYEKIKSIRKRGFFLFYMSSGLIADLVFEYVRICLLKELIDYEQLSKTILECKSELIDSYDMVGFLDSLIAVASFRESISLFCEPELTSDASGQRLEFEELYHPLIADPVKNSFMLDRSLLVTGSNASGKTTFLKTIAINAILAQSFQTCLARKYVSSIFAVITSMAIKDSVKNGESYYIVEIKSIKRILDLLNSGMPCLCLIDEVLRGTNTIERIAASSQILLQLAQQRCLCLAATHDLELTFILESSFLNVHFQEEITDQSISFDYKLRDGRATSRNAIKLLRLMGYESSIVEEAEKRADSFLLRGTWA